MPSLDETEEQVFGNRSWMPERIPRADLEEAIVEAWLSRAPKRVAKAWLDERGA